MWLFHYDRVRRVSRSRSQASRFSCPALRWSITCQLGWWLMPEGWGRIPMNLKPACVTEGDPVTKTNKWNSKAIAIILSFPETTCKVRFFSRGLNWDCQVWWQVSLPDEPSPLPGTIASYCTIALLLKLSDARGWLKSCQIVTINMTEDCLRIGVWLIFFFRAMWLRRIVDSWGLRVASLWCHILATGGSGWCLLREQTQWLSSSVGSPRGTG